MGAWLQFDAWRVGGSGQGPMPKSPPYRFELLHEARLQFANERLNQPIFGVEMWPSGKTLQEYGRAGSPSTSTGFRS